jgi:MFS family permease
MAVIGAAFGLGVIVGPGIGAALATFGLLTPVYLSASLALVNALFVAWRLPEPERAETAPSDAPLWTTGRRLWPLLLIALATSVAAVSMEQTIAFHFQDRLALSARDTARYVGIALVAYGVVAVIVQGFVVRRFAFKPRTLLFLGVPIACVGMAGLALAHSFGSLTVALGLQGLGQGFTGPGVTSAISLGVGEDEQGAAAGLNSAAQAMGRLLGPLAGTALYQWIPALPYWFGSGLLALVCLVLVLRRSVARDQAVKAAVR